jgi:hypothetical protein
MTRHRLVRCRAADLLSETDRRHPSAATHADGTGPLPRLGALARDQRPTRHWQEHYADGWTVGWWLEIEQGANGVLAHLSAAASPEPRHSVPARLSGLVLELWASRELAALARTAEAVTEQAART